MPVTELDYLMQAIWDCGWHISINSWRDAPSYSQIYALRDNTNRVAEIKISDQMLASSYDPGIVVYDAVAKLLQEYFVKALKSPQSFNAVRKLAEARAQIDRALVKTP